MSLKRRRLDLTEVSIIALTAAAIAFAAGREPLQRAASLGLEGAIELRSFERQYGTDQRSRYAEEWIIRDFFRDRRNGTFLDVGANDYRAENNTYYLETVLDWHGIAVDAQAEYEAGYLAHRPKTRFFALFVSDTSTDTVDFFVAADNRLTASLDRANASEYGAHPVETRHVPTVTLNHLLAREGAEHVDFVSMDIELAEPKALAGFDIDRFRPAFFCIEAHREVRQAILDYFARHHYVVVGKYLRMDSQNLYFAPIQAR